MRSAGIWAALGLLVATNPLWAAEPDARAVVARVVKAAGGEDKLLKLFRIKEELILGADPNGKKAIRRSVLEPPEHWWMNKRDRVSQDKEPAVFLVWAFTLRPLLDPKSKIEMLPELTEQGKPAVGLRISETITPALDIYFDKADGKLVRVDWRGDIQRYGGWKVHDGVTYPSKCVGYKKATGKPWYYSELVELERLQELPAEFRR